MEKPWGENIVEREKSMNISRGWKLLGIRRVLRLYSLVLMELESYSNGI